MATIGLYNLFTSHIVVVSVIVMIYERCAKEYQDMVDTMIRMDYVELGKGTPFEIHVCLS